jgi:hypothetical protein
VAVDGSPVMADMTRSGVKPALASRPATDIENPSKADLTSVSAS